VKSLQENKKKNRSNPVIILTADLILNNLDVFALKFLAGFSYVNKIGRLVLRLERLTNREALQTHSFAIELRSKMTNATSPGKYSYFKNYRGGSSKSTQQNMLK
jgi:uncharacterized membrane protein YcjF (UPF0283 family)